MEYKQQLHKKKRDNSNTTDTTTITRSSHQQYSSPSYPPIAIETIYKKLINIYIESAQWEYALEALNSFEYHIYLMSFQCFWKSFELSYAISDQALPLLRATSF